ncbi:MAG: hypothetical protein KAH57_11590 [Thermoplasmata archaeon]|nr:hypothetical protein [Thermoplasmata archaeon]
MIRGEAANAPRQLTLDVEEEVFRHLLFHKSLIQDEGDMYQRLDTYLGVLHDMKEGVHVTIKEPYSKSIAMILELAVEDYLDPWDVDILRFCKLFIKKIRSQDQIDLMVTGKLIRMAYTVHLMKSNNTLIKAEMGDEEEAFHDEPFYDWMEDDETFEVTRNIINDREPVISESILHKGDRPVTLVDLLDALKDVSDEVELLQEAKKRRSEVSKNIDLLNRSLINRKVYKENPEEEIRLTWQRINKFNGHPIPLSDISEGFELDDTTTFVSLLHLANQKRIKVWQRRFPFGEIYIKNLEAGQASPDLNVGELDQNLDKVKAGLDVKLKRPDEIIIEKKGVPDNLNT